MLDHRYYGSKDWFSAIIPFPCPVSGMSNHKITLFLTYFREEIIFLECRLDKWRQRNPSTKAATRFVENSAGAFVTHSKNSTPMPRQWFTFFWRALQVNFGGKKASGHRDMLTAMGTGSLVYAERYILCQFERKPEASGMLRFLQLPLSTLKCPLVPREAHGAHLFQSGAGNRQSVSLRPERPGKVTLVWHRHWE